MSKPDHPGNRDNFQDADGNRAPGPAQGDPAQRHKRPRAPQFGSDRRGPRNVDATRPASGRHPGGSIPTGGSHAGQVPGETADSPRHDTGGGSRPDRRRSTHDRRRSYS
jgi:hypothetical protein